MKPNIPKDLVGIHTIFPAELIERGRLGDFMRMLRVMIDSKMCKLSCDGKPITNVRAFYFDTDGAKIFVKESDVHDYLMKYSYVHATPIGILDTETGSYLRFTGFNLSFASVR